MRALFVLAFVPLFACLPAEATLYKSIGPNGVVQFSDTPPENGTIVAQSSLPERTAPTAANPGVASSAELDGALERANAQLDLAEHALAQARRPVWSEPDLLRVSASRLSRADRDRIDYYQKGVRLARLAVADAARRKLKAEAPALALAASTGWEPVNPAAATASNDWIPIRPIDRR